MSALSSVLLGFIQGVAEFLPISSSGHLSIFQNLFGLNTAEEGHLFFDVLLHLGTLISVFIMYRKDIGAMLREVIGWFSRGGKRGGEAVSSKPSPAGRLVFMLILSILPLFVVLPFKDYVEQLYYNTIFIGIALLLTGCMLYVADKMASGKRNEKNMTVGNALVVGICQAVAVIPGLSRSGATITAGMAVGFDREFAVKFSFLMSIPAILGANILSLIDAVKEGFDTSLLPVYFLGMLVAAVVGCVAIGLVRSLSKRGKFGYFAYYCWGAGIIAIILSIIF